MISLSNFGLKALNMQKILVPIDFSEVSEHAIDFAVLLAERFDGEITLMHSIGLQYFTEVQYKFNQDIRNMVDDVREEVDGKIKTIIKGLETKVKVTGRIATENLIKAIKQLIEEENFDLVVVGTSGSFGWDEILVGSNTEKIVRCISMPVIALPVSSNIERIQRILVPIDLKEIRKGFLREVAKLQKIFEADLEFLWVKTPRNVENDEELIDELEEVFTSHNLINFSMTIVEEIFPSDGILRYVKETGSDMLAMATHARRDISHWLSGSLTEDTLNHIDIPVWAFKLDKDEPPIELESVKNAYSTPLYKQIKIQMR